MREAAGNRGAGNSQLRLIMLICENLVELVRSKSVCMLLLRTNYPSSTSASVGFAY